MEYAIGSEKWPGLSKLIEEMGEVQQVIGKIIGADGKVLHWDGSNLPDRMVEELGDLLAAIDFVVAHSRAGIEEEQIQERRRAKGVEHHWCSEILDDAGDLVCKHCGEADEPAFCASCSDVVPERLTVYDGEEGERFCLACAEEAALVSQAEAIDG